MPAKLLEGRNRAKALREACRHRVQTHLAEGRRAPALAVVLLGQDPASLLYVQNKQKACTEVGILVQDYYLKDTTSEAELIKLIEELNSNPNIDGILVQLPLPSTIQSDRILEKIKPSKDVDGFHPENLGRLAQQKPFLRPCTPAGILLLLEQTGVSLQGLEATVIGVSNIVGRPMILELLMANATVTACHQATRDLSSHVKKADLLIVAVGRPHLIPGDWIKPGSIVVDVGINRLIQGDKVLWLGDVDFEAARQRAGWITPVPGGVGPMTVAMLLENILLAYETHLHFSRMDT